MSRTFGRIIACAIALIAIAGAACAFVLTGGCSATSDDPLTDAKNGAMNAFIDLSGVKGRIDDQVRSKAGEIASEFGVSRAVVDNIVDTLAIEDWQATTLPDGATKTGTYNVDADGSPASVTTYDDPSIVTVEAFGQTITMAVPESAQSYVPLIHYLEYVQ